MDSPPSITSSSDLYSDSEPANNKTQSHPVRNELSPSQTSQPLLEDPMSGSVGSRRSNTPPTIKGDREESLSRSRGGSTSVTAISNGLFSDAYHKRKRDHDPIDTGYAQGQPLSLDRDYAVARPSRAGSSDSLKQTLSGNEIKAPMDDWLRNKRSKTDEHASRPAGLLQCFSPSCVLPAELWQYIFCFVPPVSLGRLLRVNRAFNACLTLDQANESHPEPSLLSQVKPMSAQSIWTASRKRFCPGLPKPLRGLQDLDMWRLLRGRNCQICGDNKVLSFNSKLESPWDSGPGDKGVKVIWPFGVRCCGHCLQTSCEKVSPTVQLAPEITCQLQANVEIRKSPYFSRPAFHRVCCQPFLSHWYHRQTTSLPIVFFGALHLHRCCK